VMQTLNPCVERMFDPSRKDTNWTPQARAGSMTDARNYRGFDPDGVVSHSASQLDRQ
jgi:hypothetical protein